MIQSISAFLNNFGLAAVITAVLAYLIGSVNFAIIVTKHYNKTDIRSYGSGNAGMTNVMRSVGKKAGIITFVGDVLKGFVAVGLGMIIFRCFSDNADTLSDIRAGAYIAGIFDMLGHMFPIFFGFKGGKGVATSVGIMALVNWRACLVVLLVFAVVVLITKYISAGSIAGAVVFPISDFLFNYYLFYNTDANIASGYTVTPASHMLIFTVIAVLMGTLVVVKHKNNIIRLLNGTESKFTVKKDGE